MIVNTKNASTRWHSQKFHRAYGIQNWLVENGFCLPDNGKYKVNEQEYIALMKEFALHVKPDFDVNQKGVVFKLEKFIDNRFSHFANFVKKKFKAVENPN